MIKSQHSNDSRQCRESPGASLTDIDQRKTFKQMLCFLAYPAWHIHTQLDLLIAKILACKTYRIRILYCDVYYSTCPVLESYKTDIAKVKTCTSCQLWSKKYLTQFAEQTQIDILPLSAIRLATDADIPSEMLKEISRCSQETTFSALRTGYYGLSISSISTYEQLVFTQLTNIYRRLAILLSSMLPDYSCVFNGRFGAVNLFSTLCAIQGIKCVIHEKGTFHGSYRILLQQDRLTVEEQNLSLRNRSTSLTATDLSRKNVPAKHTLLTGSKETSHFAFNPLASSQSKSTLAWIVNHNFEKIVSFFPSTFDEYHTDSPSLREQAGFLRGIAKLASHFPKVGFVIRLHPNFFLRKGFTSTDITINSILNRLKILRLPNLHIVEKNGLTSLELAFFSSFCIVPTSSLLLDIRLSRLSSFCICMAESRYAELADLVVKVSSSFLYDQMISLLLDSYLDPGFREEKYYQEFYDKSLAVWDVDVKTSIHFDSIGSPPENPFIPDYPKLYKLLYSGNSSQETPPPFSMADLSVISSLRSLLEGDYVGFLTTQTTYI